MDQQPSWPVRQAQEIGQRIEHFRTKAGMSARQLASRCAELGMPSISRTVITKLENGRREAVSTAELQVLAAALEMPPVLLLFPLGHQATSEVLPGRAADPWSAIQWFTGYSDDPADAAAPPPMGTQSPLILWDEHLRYDQAIADARENLAEAKASGNREGVPYLTDYLTGSVWALSRVRELMRAAGMTPPNLLAPTADAVTEVMKEITGTAPIIPGVRTAAADRDDKGLSDTLDYLAAYPWAARQASPALREVLSVIVKELREGRELTADELAEALGVARRAEAASGER